MLSELSYTLKPENIAAEPRDIRLGSRDLGRMLVVDRAHATFHNSNVLSLNSYLSAGDVVVINDSKRIPGELKVRTENGAQVDLRLVTLGPEFVARAYPLHELRRGSRLRARDGTGFEVVSLGVLPHDLCVIRCNGDIAATLRTVGLPITSFYYGGYWELDHYNPSYAKHEGSVESPLAGLHFTERLLVKIRAAGVIIVPITLHVVGSWLPPAKDSPEHALLTEESYEIPHETAAAIAEAKRNGGRVVAVGSTSMRALESAVSHSGTVAPGRGSTRLILKPGSPFHIVDAYFTNFHQAQSSLMLLDAAFCGSDLVLRAYKYAQERGYLFHEFGDAVLYV